jgi:hypothetical protein
VGAGNPGWFAATSERTGFEPLTSSVQVPARLTGSSLPFVGDVGVVHDDAKQLKNHAGVNRVLGLPSVERRFVSRSSTPVGCRSVVYSGGRPKRLSDRRLISLQVDVVGRRLRAEPLVRRTRSNFTEPSLKPLKASRRASPRKSALQRT